MRGWDPARERAQRSRTALRNTEALLARSVTTSEAARILGVDRSQVSRRLTRGALYGFVTSGRAHRIPRWQFVGNRLLPGLGVLVPAIPASAAPLTVDALMRNPQPECDGTSPVDHLSSGGDPGVVAALLAALDRW